MGIVVETVVACSDGYLVCHSCETTDDPWVDRHEELEWALEALDQKFVYLVQTRLLDLL